MEKYSSLSLTNLSTYAAAIVRLIVGSKFSRTEARILLLAVDASFRRKGIGMALMNNFVEVCNRENLLSVRLEVRTDNGKRG